MSGDRGTHGSGEGAEIFERWYRAHHDRVLAQCTRLLRDRAAAEDIAQETLLRAWAGRNQMREEDLGAWLSVVARNLCISHIRRQKKQIPTEILPETPDETADPAHLVERLESRRAVRRAMRQVGERHRKVLHLRDIEGADYEEVGAELGLTPGGTRTVLFRARRVLRDRLAAVGEGIAIAFGVIRLSLRELDHRVRTTVNDATVGSVLQVGVTFAVATTLVIAGWHSPSSPSRNGAVAIPKQVSAYRSIGTSGHTPVSLLAESRKQHEFPTQETRLSSRSPLKQPKFQPPDCGERPSLIGETQAGLPYELRGGVYFNGEGATGRYTDAAFSAVDKRTTFGECESQGGSS